MVSNDTTYSQDGPSRSHLYGRILMETFSLVGILNIIVNVLLAYGILKCDRLRRQSRSIILLHFTILESIFFFTTTLTVRSYVDLEVHHFVPVHISCVLFNSEVTTAFAIILFAMLLVVDWFLKAYNAQKYRKFQKVYKVFIATVYIASFFLFANAAVACGLVFCGHSIPIVILVVGLFAIFALVLLIINIGYIVQSCRRRNGVQSNMGLAIANILVLVWIPVVCMIFLDKYKIQAPIFAILCVALGFSSPLINFAYLYFCDDKFHTILKRTILCKKGNFHNEMDDDDNSVVFNPKDGVEVVPNNVI